MINAILIEFENILCFEERQRFLFNESGLHLITGSNLDFKADSEIDATANNGIGKSSLSTLVRFALFGFARDTNKNTIVNKNVGKNLRVRFEFSIKDDLYAIERYKKHDTHKDNLYLYKNGIDISASNKTQTQQDIIDLLVITDDTFLKCSLFTREDNPRFLSLTLANRAKIFENIIHLSKFKKYLENAKYKKKVFSKLFETTQIELKAEQKNHANLVAMFNQTYESVKSKRIKLLNMLKGVNSTIDKDLLAAYERLNPLKSIREKILLKIDQEETNDQDIARSNEKISSDIKLLEAKVTSNKEIIEEKKDHSKCENCGHLPTKLTEQISKLEKDIIEVESKILVKKNLIQNTHRNEHLITLKERLDKVNQKIADIKITKEQIAEIEKSKAINTEIILDQLKETNYYQAQLLIDKIRKSRLEISQLAANKKDIEKNLEYANKAITLLDINEDNSIKQHVLTEIVPVFNDLLQKNIDYIFENLMTVTFDSNLNESILYKDQQYDFSELSTGEKTRLDLCISFSIMELTRLYLGGFNILFLDEVFSNIDEYFIIKFLKLIKDKFQDGTAIYIISHSHGLKENAEFDSVINITMENECSTISVEHS